MTKRILLAGAAFAASATFARAADMPPHVEQGWYEDGRWSVAGFAFCDGNKDCVWDLSERQPFNSLAMLK